MNRAGVVHTGPDRVFILGPSHTISVMAEGPHLNQPNGIVWDSAGRRWVVAAFDPFAGDVASWREGDTTRVVLHRLPKGRLDGIELLGGALLVSSWGDSSIHLLNGGADRQIVRGLPEPADIGVDTKRNRLAIPLPNLSRVQIWTLPSGG
jgi:hypothetical protein